MLGDGFGFRALAGRNQAEMPFCECQTRIVWNGSETRDTRNMPRQRGFEQLPVAGSGDPVEDHAGEQQLRIVPRKAADQRGGRGALPPRIDHQHDRPAGQPGQFRSRTGLAIGPGAVEQAHDAFAQHEVGTRLKFCDESRKGGRTHRPRIQVDARCAARSGMKGRIDIVGPCLRSGDAYSTASQIPKQGGRDQRLAAARGRRGEDQPASGHCPEWPIQSSAARRRTTSPIAMIVGPSMAAATAAPAASANDVTTTRWAGVVALLTIATGSCGARPAAISRVAIAAIWRNPMYSTMTGEPRAIASQSTPSGTTPSLLSPVTKVTAELMSRGVARIP